MLALEVSRLKPYTSVIAQACSEYDEDPYSLAAIMLRESGAGWAAPYNPKGDPCGWGDDPDGPGGEPGFGFGLFQIDRRYHAKFLATPEARTPLGQARYACSILRDNRRFFTRALARPATIEKLKLANAQAAITEATLCAYNAGAKRVLAHIMTFRDPNLATTHKDYARWVLKKSRALRSAARDLFDS